MAIIMNGQILSKEIKEQLKVDTESARVKYGRVPHLVVILVGENPASQSYVTGKEKACKEVGYKSTLIHLEENISEQTLLEEISRLNQDELVDGILVQLPLPKHMDEDKVINAIAIEKDVDGFSPMNVANLSLNRPCIEPCTPKGIITILDKFNVPISGSNCCVIGRSNIVGKPIAQMLLKRNGTVTICHSKTKDLASITSQADILIVAIGKPKAITKEYIKEGACVIDVGINRVCGHLMGDVDYDDCFDKAGYITPVPKGVGPMTITSLMQNTLEIFLKKNQ